MDRRKYGQTDRETAQVTTIPSGLNGLKELEQLECLRSEIPPAVSDSNQIPSQNKTKSNYKLKKIAKIKIMKLCQKTLHATHLLKLLDKMYKYEMDPTRTVGATEQTRDVGWMDWQKDIRSETNIPPPPQQLCCGEGIKILLWWGCDCYLLLIINRSVWRCTNNDLSSQKLVEIWCTHCTAFIQAESHFKIKTVFQANFKVNIFPFFFLYIQNRQPLWETALSLCWLTHLNLLNHCGLMTRYGVMDFDLHWFRLWFVN